MGDEEEGRRTDEEGQPVGPERTGEDDHEEADGEDEREEDDGCRWTHLLISFSVAGLVGLSTHS